MTTPGTPTADLPARWRAHAWAEYARGRADLAALLWACANEIQETLMGYATWLPDVLTAAGLTVRTYPGWASASSLGQRRPGPAGPLPDAPGVVWHHDASPKGDSPGALTWMRQQLTVPGAATANAWVDRYGVWHIIAAGVTWHAGTNHNYTHLGVETDHTTGEDWPPAQLDALRRGTAAILAHGGRDSSWLTFHKTILPGKKTDPDGLDLTTERAAVAALITTPEGDDDMAMTDADRKALAREIGQEVAAALLSAPIGKGAPDAPADLGWGLYRIQSELMRLGKIVATLKPASDKASQ